MQCLYCQKRLGLFASKKRPFCSEAHETAHHDAQSGLALLRLLDPMFMNSDPPPPLSATEEPTPATVEAASETVPPVTNPDKVLT
jgi:hypothetical protein